MPARSKGRLTALTVAGVMSGTSADGVDIARCRIAPAGAKSAGRDAITVELLQHRAFPYPAALRRAVVAAMNAQNISAAELARLNWRLGQVYADCVTATVSEYGKPIDLIGCHGQTIYHQAVPAPYAGRAVACTWQLGEAALLAAAAGVPVVSNFRPADMACGGQGAPLVPLLDVVLFRHATRGRVLQNLGGIGNLTAIPSNAAIENVLAFDTGPANMVLDALMGRLFGKPYDRDGRIAGRGAVNQPLLTMLLRDPYYRKVPPKSAGREQYGVAFVDRLLAEATHLQLNPEDTLATAAALTVRSIRIAYERFVAPLMMNVPVDYILSGGGARNRTLISMLERELAPFGCVVQTSDSFGLPSQAKEAVAFALLAYQTWHHRPGNVPSATGGSKPVILGQVTYV